MDKLKMIALGIMIAAMFAIPTVFALEPCPLAMQFLTSPPEANADLNLMIRWVGGEYAAATNEYGEAVVDLGHLNIPNCNAQNFELVVLGCVDNPACHKTVSFNPSGYTIIDIRSANLFIPTTSTTTTTTTTEPATTTTTLPCECANCESQGFIAPGDCPKNELTAEEMVAIMGSLAIGAGVGLKVTKFGTKTHYHPGRTDNHSLDLMHKAPYAHKKGEAFPKYEKDEKTGLWKYRG